MTQGTQRQIPSMRSSRFGDSEKKISHRFGGGKDTGSGTGALRTRNAAPFNRFSVRVPRIRLVTPGRNFIVSGFVFILIDAAAELDPVGSLKVDVQIDGAAAIRADYSAKSGYYGAI